MLQRVFKKRKRCKRCNHNSFGSVNFKFSSQKLTFVIILNGKRFWVQPLTFLALLITCIWLPFHERHVMQVLAKADFYKIRLLKGSQPYSSLGCCQAIEQTSISIGQEQHQVLIESIIRCYSSCPSMVLSFYWVFLILCGSSGVLAGWQEATIIPVPTPGKDGMNPANYRPISLTNCLCKTMEKMVNWQLVYFLERHNLLSNVHCGFQPGRS